MHSSTDPLVTQTDADKTVIACKINICKNVAKHFWLEGVRESAYLRQVNFYRRPHLAKMFKGDIWMCLNVIDHDRHLQRISYLWSLVTFTFNLLTAF